MTHLYESSLVKTVNPLSLVRKMGMEYFSVSVPIMILENIFEVTWKIGVENADFVEI